MLRYGFGSAKPTGLANGKPVQPANPGLANGKPVQPANPPGSTGF